MLFSEIRPSINAWSFYLYISLITVCQVSRQAAPNDKSLDQIIKTPIFVWVFLACLNHKES